MFVVHHAIWSITSIAHLFGTMPHQTNDESRNSYWLAILTGAKGGTTIITPYPVPQRSPGLFGAPTLAASSSPY